MSEIQAIDPKSIQEFATPVDAIHLKNLPSEEQATIAETHKIGPATIQSTDKPSDSDKLNSEVTLAAENPSITKVATEAGIIQEKDPQETITEIEMRLKDEILAAKLDDDKPKLNYLTRMSQLIAEISILLNQWTNKDNARIEEKKEKYKEGSTEIAGNHYTKAQVNLLLGIASAAISLWSPNASLGPLQQAANNFLDGQATKPNQENQMLIQVIQKLGESSSANNALKDQALNLLEQIKQLMLRATSHG